MPTLQTSRLALVPATATHLQAELVSRAALGAALNAEVPTSWPPELYDEDAVRYFLSRVLEHPEQSGWGSHYVVRCPTALEMPLLIGAGGFKGAPDEAESIEVGYAVGPSISGVATRPRPCAGGSPWRSRRHRYRRSWDTRCRISRRQSASSRRRAFAMPDRAMIPTPRRRSE